jgi:hypothetical protein
MGMLKRMKDMKDMVNAAPGMVAQSQQLAAQAQEMAAAQQAAAQAQLAQYQQAQFGPGPAQQAPFQQAPFGGGPAPAVPAGPDFEPIAGVSLEQFARVSKGVAAYNYDAAKLPDVALSQGIDPVSWQSAHQGWNDRIKANPAVAQQFNQLYRVS